MSSHRRGDKLSCHGDSANVLSLAGCVILLNQTPLECVMTESSIRNGNFAIVTGVAPMCAAKQGPL